MEKRPSSDEILDYIHELFPTAKAELDFTTDFQLLVAVILSAQTTDIAVNKVTPALFAEYPDAFTLAVADVKKVETYIKTIGLYRNKAKMIVEMAKILVEEYNGVVPTTMQQLVKLPGVGRKTANVVRSVAFDIPSFAVDTHVNRVAKRLRFAKVDDDIETVEIKLKRKIKRARWNQAHHQMIFFGRYFCKAISPRCNECRFASFCAKDKLEKYKKTKGTY